MTDDLLITRMALLFAYEAGRWRGQVDLEEHYDNEQYSIALAEESAHNALKSKDLSECLTALHEQYVDKVD